MSRLASTLLRGLSIACSCDIRFAAAGAKLTPAFSKRGLIAEHDLSWSLPHLIGTSRAMHWLMTSDVLLSEQAKEYGLVQEVYSREELLPAVRIAIYMPTCFDFPSKMQKEWRITSEK